MTESAPQTTFDAAAYLAWEERQAEKHEYLSGEVFAMVGARREHVVLAGNLFASLKQRLRGGPCQAYVSGLKLHVEAADAFFYPDVMVSCDPRDRTSGQYINHPTLIVEVLSDSTAAFDRGNKFAAYRTLDSLQEYVLVDIKARRVETFRRTESNDCLFHEFLPGCGDCVFPELCVSVPFEEIFEDLPPAAEGTDALSEPVPEGSPP